MCHADGVVFDYRAFFCFGEAFVRGSFRAHLLGELDHEWEDITRGEIVPVEPVRFHHDQGGRLQDLIGTTEGTLTLVSARLVEVLATNGFSGWSTYPIELYDEHGGAISGYHGFAATGRSGPIDPSLSPVMPVPPPVPEGETLPHRIGWRFAPETWDGSDVFSPDGSAAIVVSRSVRDALLRAKVRNVDLTRITEIETLVLDDEDGANG